MEEWLYTPTDEDIQSILDQALHKRTPNTCYTYLKDNSLDLFQNFRIFHNIRKLIVDKYTPAQGGTRNDMFQETFFIFLKRLKRFAVVLLREKKKGIDSTEALFVSYFKKQLRFMVIDAFKKVYSDYHPVDAEFIVAVQCLKEEINHNLSL